MVDLVSTISTLSIGIILTLIRLAEPYFRFLIRKRWNQWFGIWLKETDSKNNAEELTDTLAAFLTASLNVELVHIILKGITKFSKVPLV